MKTRWLHKVWSDIFRSKKSWRIRTQMYFGAIMLLVIMFILSIAGIQGVLKFRSLTKVIRHRATELPLTAELSQNVSDLRVAFAKVQVPPEREQKFYQGGHGIDHWWSRNQFRGNLEKVQDTLNRYEEQLNSSPEIDSSIADISQESAAVTEIRDLLCIIESDADDIDMIFENEAHCESINADLDDLQEAVQALPTFMKQRMDSFAESARANYHAWLAFSIIMTCAALVLILSLAILFRKWIFKPLQALIAGSREVAAGNYDYRIKLETEDEMAELANALNEMTSGFQTIRRELNDQVRQRTKEVVRSEQMASVGFLAAGVAHEINNPLAAIAWSAESLEMRIHDILAEFDPMIIGQDSDDQDDEENRSRERMDNDITEMKTYLRRIQDEAFRCKGITGSLLDFSRLGDASRQPTELVELIQGVIDMVRPLSKYRRRNIEFQHDATVNAQVIAHELKQVALNLLTNALDSVEEKGTVRISLRGTDQQAVLTVEDDGCGMTDEIKKHLFEPFFTRRHDGKGTGLGLSITYRIIDEHSGTIEPFSDGPGRGSKFVVKLPLVKNDERQKSAA